MMRLRPARGIAVVEEGDVVYAATLPDGPIIVLDGGAAAIWSAACDGPRASIAERVAAATDVPVDTCGPTWRRSSASSSTEACWNRTRRDGSSVRRGRPRDGVPAILERISAKDAVMASTSTRAEIWRERIADLWANMWRWVLMAFAAVAAIYLLLDRGVQNGAMLAVVIAVFVIGAAVSGSQPLAIALLSMPLLLIPQRIGLGGGDLSVSDAALAAAFGTAVLLGKRPFSAPLRNLLWINLFYQFTTLLTVIVNPYAANTVEWVHAWLLVSGALIVGWAVGAGGYARLALKLIVITACVMAVLTIVQGVFNFASGTSGPVAHLAVRAAQELRRHGAGVRGDRRLPQPRLGRPGRRRTRRFAVLVDGLRRSLLTQSRQALIGLMAAIIVVVAPSQHDPSLAPGAPPPDPGGLADHQRW